MIELDPAAIMAERLIRSHDTRGDLLVLAYAVRDLNRTLAEERAKVQDARRMIERFEHGVSIKAVYDQLGGSDG